MSGRTHHCVPIVLVGVFFSLAKVALSHAETQPIPPVRDVQVSDIFIPPELGYVVGRHEPTGTNPHPRLIVHIQEAHTNYEAQQHLVGILEQLVERYGLKLILVEGGQGDVSLAYLRSYGPPENRKQVAEKYLKAGILSGEEYLEIVSDYPLILWGVEQKELYQDHLETFLETEGLQESLRPILASVRQATETLAPRLSSPALKQLEGSREAFERGELGLGDYANTLATLAGPQVVSEEAYPNLYRFLEVRRLEGDIDLSRVPAEQQALIAQLSRSVDEEKLERLVAQAIEMKSGQVTRAEFYTSLEELATTSHIDLEQFQNLSRYSYYVKHSAQIEPPRLAEELDELAAHLRAQLASTLESRHLTTIMEQLELMEKLLELRLSPEEHQRLQSWDQQGMLSGWGRFLNEQLARQGLPIHSFAGLDELEAQLSTVQRFYEAAQKRDDALVANTMAKLRETNERLAVLITGGFHSPKVTQLLKEEGVAVVVLAPKVSQATDERLYHAVLKYKSGHGSFEDVMAIANKATDSGSGR